MSARSTLHDALGLAQAAFIRRNPKSQALHDDALSALPGGNTRTVLHTDPFPIYMKSGKGHQVTSEDGKTYTDLTGEFSAGLYGHSNPVIFDAIQHVMQNIGLSVGATTAQELRYAKELCQRFNLQQVRFTNSGTEANLQALAAARLFTQKKRVVVFKDGYHGSVLGFAGGKPGPNTVDIDGWIVVPYNDIDAATRAMQGDDVAAVLVEGVQGAGGCICGTQDFLQAVQRAAAQAGAIFILDEVMTSRLSPNGIAGIHNLQPDLKTYGKYLGGGLAFGAFGGRRDIMSVFDPRHAGSAAHSGTFNNNTLVTHTGYAGLTRIYTPEVAVKFTETGNQLISRLNHAAENTKMSFTGMGSIMTAHFTATGSSHIKNAERASEIPELAALFWLDMLEQGFWITRRGYIALILDTPPAELDRFVGAVERFVSEHKALLALEA